MGMTLAVDRERPARQPWPWGGWGPHLARPRLVEGLAWAVGGCSWAGGPSCDPPNLSLQERG